MNLIGYVGYDSDRTAAEQQLQRRVRQAELALAQAKTLQAPQEPCVAVPSAVPVPPTGARGTCAQAASPRSPDFGSTKQPANAPSAPQAAPCGPQSRQSPDELSMLQASPSPGFRHGLHGSGSPEFHQRVDAIRFRLQAMPQAPEGLQEEDMSQEKVKLHADPQIPPLPLAYEDPKLQLALEAENKELIQRLRQTELMTQEAAEAQLEADEQIDADFRNLEEKLQGELNDVAQEGIQLEEHWFRKAEQLQQELSEEAKLARELPKEHAMATRLQQAEFHAQASAAGHTWTGQELQAMLETQQENKSLQMAEVRALQNELREQKEICRRFALEEAQAFEESQLQQDTSKQVQEQVQTKVHALQHELREEREVSRRFALEEVQTKKKSVERIAEMQSEKQDLLEQIVGLKRLLDDEKQVGKLLASQRMVAARVQATITQEMAELTEQEASQAEHLQRLNFAESTCAEELMDLRFDVELRAASLCRSQVRVARAMRWDANRQKASKSAEQAEVSVPAKIQNELVKLETALNHLWDARTKQALHAGPTKKAPSQDAELHLRAQLARAEMKALRFQGGQEMAEKRIIKLQSELSELEKAMWKDELNVFLEAGDDGDGTAQLEEDLGLEKPENEEVQSESEIPSRSMSEALTDVGEIRRHGQGSVHSWRKSWAHVDSLEFQAQQDQQHLQRDGVKLTRAATLSPLTQEAQPRDWRMSWSGV